MCTDREDDDAIVKMPIQQDKRKAAWRAMDVRRAHIILRLILYAHTWIAQTFNALVAIYIHICDDAFRRAVRRRQGAQRDSLLTHNYPETDRWMDVLVFVQHSSIYDAVLVRLNPLDDTALNLYATTKL